MTMKKTYYTVNGELIGEKTTGGSRLDYLTDALGSVTATLNQSAQVVNTYRYKPYGSQLAKTGTGTDPSFTWVGTKGYRQTGNQYSDTYVRARVYSSTLGRWTTSDPIKSRGGDWNYYGYVHQRPTVRRDPSGLIDPWSCPACIGIVGGTLLGLLWACNGDPRGFAACAICALERNPALAWILVGSAAIACGICIPQLAPIIIRIGTGGLGLAGTPALAGGFGNFLVKDPCNPPPIGSCPLPRSGPASPPQEGPGEGFQPRPNPGEGNGPGEDPDLPPPWFDLGHESCEAYRRRGFREESESEARDRCGSACAHKERPNTPATECSGGFHNLYVCRGNKKVSTLCCPCITEGNYESMTCRCFHH